MKIIKLFHNPKAGDQDFTEEKLVKLIASNDYECRYTSTKKKGWKEIEPDIDIIAVAGGDGTVRKVSGEILQRTLLDKKYPIAVLPMGTANNIGNALGLMIGTKELVSSWKKHNIRHIDIGKVNGHDEPMFFIEGFGFGVFPNLMNAMKERGEDPDATAEENLQTALTVLLKIVQEYKARECKLEIDGVDHSGKFLLVEIMSMPSIGPNLNINPLADPGDGELEIIIIPENQRQKFEQYIQDKIEGKEEPFCFSALKGKDIKVTWEGVHAHVDDEIIKTERSFDVTIDVHNGVLDFIVPAPRPDNI